MNLIEIVCFWDQKLEYKIQEIVEQNDFPFFIRALATKQQFWYACVWMSMFTNEYFQKNPMQDLELYFQKADKVISNMPDLFNDRIYMQAHGLLWKYGFKRFFNNIHHAVYIAEMLTKQKTNDNIND